ncbi:MULTISPECIES: hypothetical protein [unclassified Streptomyces]|jgi:hypothetical protein|uniref:Integral membrane protein n=1 Tax=Streptomyces thermocoprophilus TaxID=78356 RepID=A0ABV5VKD4_9ACTN|nr:hypothetical protein [Streptomyces sp. XM83C]
MSEDPYGQGAANPYGEPDRPNGPPPPGPWPEPGGRQDVPFHGPEPLASGMPPMPSAPPPAPADGLLAVAVAVLNLSGLGLKYALLRRWLPMLACWATTAVLLLVMLPADPDGVPAGLLVGHAAVLLAAAVHGGIAGLRRRPSWPSHAPLALLRGLVLLAVPAAGAVHKPDGDSVSSPGTDTAKLEPGHIHTECACTSQGLGTTL